MFVIIFMDNSQRPNSQKKLCELLKKKTIFMHNSQQNLLKKIMCVFYLSACSQILKSSSIIHIKKLYFYYT
jgi:hypothetical protein